jgi:hypothetical protein
MKGLALLLVKVILLILAILSILYFLNIPITEVAGEKIGFADLINFLLFQAPPQLPEKSVESNTEISSWASKMNGSDLGDSAGMLSKLGNPIKFCVFKDYSYCQIYRIESGKMHATTEAAQKTVYISYELAFEIKTRTETQNFQGFESRLVEGIKSGEIKGLTLGDVMSIGT